MTMAEGWEPLAKFLGKPIPEEPFPWASQAEINKNIAAKTLLRALLTWAGVSAVVGGGLYVGWQTMS